MEVAFRVDASPQIGGGHLSRCLALADALRSHRLSSTFLLGSQSKSAVSAVEAGGHRATVLMAPPGESTTNRWLDVPPQLDAQRTTEAIDTTSIRLLIVDQYGLDHRWERIVQEHTGAFVVAIDGLATRRHHCDLLIDPTYSEKPARRRWGDLVSSHTKLLCGPKYALLRPNFESALHRRTQRPGRIPSIFICFGGGDTGDITELAIDVALRLSIENLQITAVCTSATAGVEQLQSRYKARQNVDVVIDTDQVASLMACADLAIGGAGTMTWERAFLGLPALVVAIADHQVDVARPVADTGAIEFLGRLEDLDSSHLYRRLEDLIEKPKKLRRMAKRCRQLVDNATEVGTTTVAAYIYDNFSRGEIWKKNERARNRK